MILGAHTNFPKYVPHRKHYCHAKYDRNEEYCHKSPHQKDNKPNHTRNHEQVEHEEHDEVQVFELAHLNDTTPLSIFLNQRILSI